MAPSHLKKQPGLGAVAPSAGPKVKELQPRMGMNLTPTPLSPPPSTLFDFDTINLGAFLRGKVRVRKPCMPGGPQPGAGSALCAQRMQKWTAHHPPRSFPEATSCHTSTPKMLVAAGSR